jgi:hypothetical protein
MRLWVTALALVGVGGWLVWLGAAQINDAWPRSLSTVSGAVAEVEPGVLAAGGGRTTFKLKGHAHRFELPPPSSSYPTAGQLADAGQVSVDYDQQVRIRAGSRRQYEPVYVVTGLAVDGRVYFTPVTYRLMVALWALALTVPGGVAFGCGATWIYRLSRNRHWRPRPWRLRTGYARVRALAASAVRDRRKTADGEWLH